jgi:hypothetical protein
MSLANELSMDTGPIDPNKTAGPQHKPLTVPMPREEEEEEE